MTKKRKLGKNGPLVNPIGYGCMGISGNYGKPLPPKEGHHIIKTAYHEYSVDFFDTADMYGLTFGSNETLVGEALKGFRNKVILATKCALTVKDTKITINNTPAYIKQACENSLARLQTKYIDLYYLHRKDNVTPIEDVALAMQDLLNEGKIRYVGLSEANVETIERAYAILDDKLVVHLS